MLMLRLLQHAARHIMLQMLQMLYQIYLQIRCCNA